MTARTKRSAASSGAAKVAKLVCGGQTGADRAAVEFAITFGVAYGGWVPRGGWAEDFPEPPGLLARYPAFIECDTCDPALRSDMNVRDSDATVVFTTESAASPGTARTCSSASRLQRPLAVITVGESSATDELRAFLAANGPAIILNVAGPRESEAPGLYALALELLSQNGDQFAGEGH
ncbi:MAG: putative molybdenum carrier protein [Acidimicrobiales bacterium]